MSRIADETPELVTDPGSRAQDGVTFVVPRYLPRLGGVEVHIRELSRRLAASGMDVEVLSQESGLRRAEHRRDAGLVRVTMLPGTRDLLGQGISLGAWAEVRALWQGERIIHLHNFNALSTLLVGLQPARHRSAPFVMTPHYLGIPGGWHGLLHRPYDLAFTPIFRELDAIICTTNAERDELARDQRVDPAKIHVIPNGVNAELFAHAEPIEHDYRSIVAAGRLLPHKHWDRVIEALPFLPADVHLDLVGDGAQEAELRRRAAELGVAERLHLHNNCSQAELARFYRAAAAVVSLSERESFGLTLVEGLASGAPVVASDIPPHRDVLALCGLDPDATVGFDVAPAGVAERLLAAVEGGRHEPGAIWIPTWDFVAAEHRRLYAELRRA